MAQLRVKVYALLARKRYSMTVWDNDFINIASVSSQLFV